MPGPLLNGDRTVGYTLHEVSAVLDGGKIYYTFGYKIQDDETYFHAKNAINNDINTKLPTVIQDVLDGKITGTSQENAGFIYAAKLIPEGRHHCQLGPRNFEHREPEHDIFTPAGNGIKDDA